MKGRGERELEGRGRTSSYLELLSCNLLERRQGRYKQKSQTDGFWLWGEGNIRYLLAKWQSVLIVHNTATTLPMECQLLNQGKERGEEKNPILSLPPPPPHSISSLRCMSTCPSNLLELARLEPAAHCAVRYTKKENRKNRIGKCKQCDSKKLDVNLACVNFLGLRRVTPHMYLK